MEHEVKLTGPEIEMLFEALEIWEKEALQSALFSGLLTSIFAQDEHERETAMDQEMEKAKQKEMSRKRTSILLKAKLIQAMDDCATEGLFEQARAVIES